MLLDKPCQNFVRQYGVAAYTRRTQGRGGAAVRRSACGGAPSPLPFWRVKYTPLLGGVIYAFMGFFAHTLIAQKKCRVLSDKFVPRGTFFKKFLLTCLTKCDILSYQKNP